MSGRICGVGKLDSPKVVNVMIETCGVTTFRRHNANRRAFHPTNCLHTTMSSVWVTINVWDVKMAECIRRDVCCETSTTKYVIRGKGNVIRIIQMVESTKEERTCQHIPPTFTHNQRDTRRQRENVLSDQTNSERGKHTPLQMSPHSLSEVFYATRK